MNTGLGGWMPISRYVAEFLPTDRPFTELEALYSVQLDYCNGKRTSVSGYSKRWGWSRKRVDSFLFSISAEIRSNGKSHLGGTITPSTGASECTSQEQVGCKSGSKSGASREQVRLIVINDLGTNAAQVRSKSGASQVASREQVESKSGSTTIEIDIETENDKQLPPLPPIGGTGEEGEEAVDQQQLDQSRAVNDDHPEKPVPPNCPHQKIIDLYHEILCPQLPRVKRWTESRGRHLKARWNETDESQTIEWWEEYFKTVKKCPWLMGEVEPSSGGKRFMADIDWLINQTNMAKVLEGKYSQGGVQKSLFGAPHSAVAPPRTCPIGTTAFGIISTENGENDEQQ